MPEASQQGSGSDPAQTPHERLVQDPEFIALRSQFIKFVFPLTAAFMIWYFLYVFMAILAPEFMATQVVGNINIGLIFGLLQFVSTFVITLAYRNWADKKLDPSAESFRNRIEGEMAQ
jgi:uncharacterized membrane protein (DUF485 family)